MPKLNPEIPDLSADEAMMESRLSSVSPTGILLNRDELMFRAGRRSARRSISGWQALAACMAACLAISMLSHSPSESQIARTTVNFAPPHMIADHNEPLQWAFDARIYSPYSVAMLRKLVDDPKIQDQLTLPNNSNAREPGSREIKLNVIPQAHFTPLTGDSL